MRELNEQQFAELAAGHALHALSPEDEQTYIAALAAHPEWEHVAREDAATATALADATLQVTPPAALRTALLAQIAQTPQTPSSTLPPSPAQAPPAAQTQSSALPPQSDSITPAEPSTDTATIQAVTRRTWTRGLFGLAASLILLVALGFGAVTIGQQLHQPASVTALEQIQDASDAQSATVALDAGGTATAYWSGSIGKAVLVSDELPAIGADQSYELWLVRDGSAIPAGLIDAEATSDVTAVLDGQMFIGDAIAITVEQAGGSANGQPTTTPIVVIPTSA